MSENAIWNSRRQALTNGIANAQGYLKDLPPENQKESINCALDYLQQWCDKQFDYFVEAFEEGSLQNAQDFVLDYALRRTLDQMAYDLLIYKRAYYQRLEIKNTETELAALKMADRVARWALQPAIDAGMLHNDTAVITYFQKAADVRVIPYVPLALIGVPYTCTDSKKIILDFLAIPHEVGHYVYWHGSKKRQDSQYLEYIRVLIDNNLQDSDDQPDWVLSWIEEIFADIYGTLVAGPLSPYALQEMLIDNLHFNSDDGRHPIPRIRPFAQHRVLQRLQVNTEGLQQHWYTQIKERGYDDSQISQREKVEIAPNQFIPYETAKEAVENAAEKIFDIVVNEFPQFARKPIFTDSNDSFREMLIQFKSEIVENDTLPSPNPIMSKNKLDQRFELLRLAKDAYAARRDWSSLLVNNGWIVAGPETDHG